MTRNSEPEYDLFGDPVPSNWGNKGRPAHIATNDNAFKVKVLVAEGRTDQYIANVLGVSIPTLKRHYFSILQDRDAMREKLRAAHRAAVFRKGLEGDTSALRLAWQMMVRDEAGDVEAKVRARLEREREQETPVKLGKKERRQRTADKAAGKFAVRNGPSRLIN